jgi:hypothetical protein
VSQSQSQSQSQSAVRGSDGGKEEKHSMPSDYFINLPLSVCTKILTVLTAGVFAAGRTDIGTYVTLFLSR